jgi:hypothetical protein
MRRGAGLRPRRHYAGHELKGRVPEATLGIAARGEARLFSRSAEAPDYASGVSGSCPKDGERQGARVGVDRISGHSSRHLTRDQEAAAHSYGEGWGVLGIPWNTYYSCPET